MQTNSASVDLSVLRLNPSAPERFKLYLKHLIKRNFGNENEFLPTVRMSDLLNSPTKSYTESFTDVPINQIKSLNISSPSIQSVKSSRLLAIKVTPSKNRINNYPECAISEVVQKLFDKVEEEDKEDPEDPLYVLAELKEDTVNEDQRNPDFRNNLNLAKINEKEEKILETYEEIIQHFSDQNQEAYVIETIIPPSPKVPPVKPKRAFRNSSEKEQSKLVRDLVLERFAKELQELSRRSLDRKRQRLISSRSSIYASEIISSSATTKKVESDFGSLDFTHDSGLELMHSTPKNRSSLSLTSNNKDVTYDEKEFLKAALGDIYCEATILESSRIKEEGKTPSIDTGDVSVLVSRDSLYSTVAKSKKFKKKKNKCEEILSEKDNSKDIDTDNYYSTPANSCNSRSTTIERDLAKLDETIKQISKLLHVTSLDKKTVGYNAHLEAERILLEAIHRRDVLLQEQNRIYENVPDLENPGEIVLSHLRFNFIKEQTEYPEHFVCVVTCDETVITSEIMTTKLDFLDVPTIFKIENITANFEIVIYLYSILEISQEMKSFSCMSAKKLFHLKSKNASLDVDDATPRTKTPAFKLIGKSRINMHDLKKPHYKFCLMKSANLFDYFTAEIKCQVFFRTAAKGFLTIGYNNCTSWNRRWCVLSGVELMYWNHPSEEDLCDPVGMINLQYCLSQNIAEVDRTLCSRPWTMMFTVEKSNKPRKLVDCFLSADNKKDFLVWNRKLNTTLATLRSWNSMKC